MDSDLHWQLVYRPATLVFKTVHFDRAGETSSHCLVTAEVADVSSEGMALLVTRDGVPVNVPVTKLFPVHPSGTPVEAQSYLGGQELQRHFHAPDGQPRAVLRWLERAELEALLSASDLPSRRVRRRV